MQRKHHYLMRLLHDKIDNHTEYISEEYCVVMESW